MLKNNLLKISSGIPVTIFLVLINIFRSPAFINNKTYLLLFSSYGAAVSFSGLDLFGALLFSLPFIFHVLLFSNDLHQDFSTASAYIFTRKDTRTKWLHQKCLNFEIKSFLYYSVQFLIIILICAVKGYELDLRRTVLVIFMLTITLINMNNLWVLLGCVLTIRKSSIVIISGILGAYTGWIFMLPVLKDSMILIETVPITRCLLSVHKLPYFFDNIQLGIPDMFTIQGTFLWGIAARGILYFLSTGWIKNMDLI